MKAHFSTVPSFMAQLGALVAMALAPASPAHAVDGCTVLLCMAGNWQRIAQCEPTVRQAMRDVARGRGWPSCEMGGSSASGNQYVAPLQCPEQYRTSSTTPNGRVVHSCPYTGVVHVAVEGQPWSRTWWSASGESVVEWLPAAKAAFASTPDAMDDRFERDHAAWILSEQIRLAAEAKAAVAAAQGGGG